MPPIPPFAFWMLTMALIVIAAFVGWSLGVEHGRDVSRNEGVNAAAAGCPTCAALVEPAERLESIGARVSGVEYFGHRDPEADPVEDANWLLRLGQTHARRVRLNRARLETDAKRPARQLS